MSEKDQEPKKQHTPEFENCVADVMKQGHEKGSAFAICTETFKKADKPLYVGESESQKLHLFSESIKLKAGNKVSGVCIHPKRIFHPEEGLEHVYLREELKKAAPTLIGKPFGIDHLYPLPPPNVITNAWYDLAEDGVAFEGTVDDAVSEQIQNKAFKGLSIELSWLRPGGKVEFMDGVAPRNFELTGVHFLKHFPPGDKDAYIKFWNAIMEQLVQAPAVTLDDKVDSLIARFDSFTNWVNERFAKIEGVLTGVLGKNIESTQATQATSAVCAGSNPAASSSQSSQRNTTTTPVSTPGSTPATLTEAEWDAEYVNDLPDSAFGYIEPGGEKGEQGKTKPRSLRHFEHHNMQGNLDERHVANGLARLGQDLGPWATDQVKAQLKNHLCKHAKELKMQSEVCGLEGESEDVATLKAKISELQTQLAEAQNPDVVALRKQIVGLEAKVAESEKQTKAAEKRLVDFHKLVESVVPASGIWKGWTPGPKRMIQELQRVLRELALSKS